MCSAVGRLTMSIDAQSLKEQVIEPTLKYLNDTNLASANLLLGTAAVETKLKPLGLSSYFLILLRSSFGRGMEQPGSSSGS